MNWISVKDRLPRETQTVLVYMSDDSDWGTSSWMETGALYDANWGNRDDGNKIKNFEKFPVKLEWSINQDDYPLNFVSHWMPLPKAPWEKPTIEPEDWED